MLPSFVNPDVHASERNADDEGRNAALESEKGSSAEKDDEVRVSVGMGAEETVTSCDSLFYYAVYSSSFEVSRRGTNGDPPEHLEGQLKERKVVHAVDMV